MIITRASHEILTDISNPLSGHAVNEAPGIWVSSYSPGFHELKAIERVARTCYKSEDRISVDDESARKLIRHLIEDGHDAMLEHGSLTVKFICDRAVSHELVRHRMASYAQESQRYCNYSKDKFGGNVTFICPWWMNEMDVGYPIWREVCLDAEKAYFDLLDKGYLPQQARMVLPNCTKTEVVVTANYREWRHILKLRTAKDAHPDIRRLMEGLLNELHESLPVIFDDIPAKEVWK